MLSQTEFYSNKAEDLQKGMLNVNKFCLKEA